MAKILAAALVTLLLTGCGGNTPSTASPLTIGGSTPSTASPSAPPASPTGAVEASAADTPSPAISPVVTSSPAATPSPADTSSPGEITITGTIEYKEDVTDVYQQGQNQKRDTIDDSATVTLTSTDGKTVLGTEITGFFANHEISEPNGMPDCRHEVDMSGNLSWTATLTGTITQQADGSLMVDASGSPQLSPGYPSGACAGGGTSYLALFPPIGTLVDGKLDQHTDYPLHSGGDDVYSGYQYFEEHLMVVPNQGGG